MEGAMVDSGISPGSRFNRTILAVLATVSIGLLCATGARAAASEDDVTRGAPVFFEIRPGQALVYFVNDLYPSEAQVYLDSTAIGILPRKSYTAAIINPGFRLIWGSSEARWYEFKPGWAYLLRLVKAGAMSSAWVTDNPGILGALVVDKNLGYVTTHADILARLHIKAAGSYEQAVKRAGTKLALPYRRRFHALDLGEKSPATRQAERP
jgi:hypothetical protein